jgi:hypothetical protein
MPEAVPELVWFSLLFFAFAFVWSARKLLAAMFDPFISVLAHIPLFGGFSADFLKKMEQDIDNKLGSIEHGIDALMGASFHRFVELNEWLWREFKKHTLIGQLLSAEYSALTHAYEYLRGLAHRAVAVAESIPHSVRQLEREYHGIEHRVKTIEREIAHGIGDDVLPRLKTLDREIDRLEHKTIPAIRAAERDAEAAISDLYEWAKGKASLLGVGTFSLAVAAALAALGLGWLRCSNNPFSKSKAPCSLWDDLAKLLGLAGLLAIAFDFQEFVDAAETVASGIGGAVTSIEGTFPLALPPLPPPN